MRFDEVMGRYGDGRLSCEEAADVLGMSVSSFYRWRRRFESAGVEGLADGRIGKSSARRAPTDEVARMLAPYETRYFDFTAKHFHEKAVAEHDLKRSYTWTKNRLREAGKVGKAKRRGTHRRKRPWKPLVGMMLHQDGSRHEWVSGQEWDLIVTSCRRHARGMMDDADSTIHSAFFVAEEGTMSSFQGVRDVIEQRGLFGSPYADRGTHYWITTEAGGKVDKTNPTQFHRGLKQLGIELIAAYSPEARGRSERMFGTLQRRLPQEPRVAGVTTMDDANRYLRETFLPAHNAHFGVAPAESGSAFVSWAGGDLGEIPCIREERTVGNDNTVRYNRLVLQIPADRHRHHYVKAKVRVHEHADGTLAIFHGARCLARFDGQGRPSDAEGRKVAA